MPHLLYTSISFPYICKLSRITAGSEFEFVSIENKMLYLLHKHLD